MTAIVVVMAVLFYKITFSKSEQSSQLKEFPDYESLQISSGRKDILKIIETELEASQGMVFDQSDEYGNGIKYSDGVREPWCADFVSWIYKESGHEFSNPNNGGWRIPGIYTLKEYFDSLGRWHDYGDYQPIPGDVVIYKGGLFQEHTNIVVSINGDELTTVGGNENGIILMYTYQYKDPKYGIWGFGNMFND